MTENEQLADVLNGNNFGDITTGETIRRSVKASNAGVLK